MTLKIGTDMVYIPRFDRALRENREHFLQNVFCQEELSDANVERLAGIFASKEAVTKALSLKPGQWREIRVAHEQSGKPYLVTFPSPDAGMWSHELTITHDGDYAIAIVVFYN